MSIEALSPGLLTTVQDAGRIGHRHVGVGSAGAADAFSLAVANLLVGNAMDAAALEITLAGPTLRFGHATRIALCGGMFEASIDGLPYHGQRGAWLPAGATLSIGACRQGCRAYLAVAGGIDVPRLMGSRSTDLRAGFGGHAGRALRRGDRLPVAGDAAHRASLVIDSHWMNLLPDLDPDPMRPLRVLPGRDACAPPNALFTQPWTVTAASNRQGCRLSGRPLVLSDPGERVSEPVTPGTIQLPPDGQPIVLMAEAQTVGGYPRIGHVIDADLPRLAQRRPGDRMVFAPIDEAGAEAAAAAQAHRLARMAIAIQHRAGL